MSKTSEKLEKNRAPRGIEKLSSNNILATGAVAFILVLIIFTAEEWKDIYLWFKSEPELCVNENAPPSGKIKLEGASGGYVLTSQVLKGKACDSKAKGKCIDALILFGGIDDPATVDEMKAAIALYKQDVKAVCLASSGGRMSATEDLYNAIRASGLDTCMASHYEISQRTDKRIEQEVADIKYPVNCSSACSFLLYASERRVALGNDFKILVHQPGKKYCIKGKMEKYDFSSKRNEVHMMAILNYVKNTPSLGVPAELVDKFHQLVISRPYSKKDLLPIDVEKAFELKIFNANELSLPHEAQL